MRFFHVTGLAQIKKILKTKRVKKKGQGIVTKLKDCGFRGYITHDCVAFSRLNFYYIPCQVLLIDEQHL